MMETIEKRSKNKTREQLAEMFIKSLDEQKLPWYAVWNTHPQQNAVSAKALSRDQCFSAVDGGSSLWL